MVDKPIHRAVRTILIADPALLAMINDQVQPFNSSGITLPPYITYQMIDKERERTMGPTYGLAMPIFQLDCWAYGYDDAVLLGLEMQRVLDGFSGTVNGIVIQDVNQIDEGDAHDPRGEAHGKRYDYRFVYEVA